MDQRPPQVPAAPEAAAELWAVEQIGGRAFTRIGPLHTGSLWNGPYIAADAAQVDRIRRVPLYEAALKDALRMLVTEYLASSQTPDIAALIERIAALLPK